MSILLVFVRFLIIALYLVLLGRVLMSWVNPRFDGPLGRFLFESTEPILAPIRRVLPQSGVIDFSPLVAFVLLSMVMAAIGLR
jgi:YggT family protein